MQILVVHASALGSTEGIAEAIGRTLGEHGATPMIRPAEHAPSPSGFDAVVIGSAVHAGRWLASGTHYIRRHRLELAALPVWLFSVGPLGGIDPDSSSDPAEIAEFRRDLGPRDHRVLSGAHDRSSPRIERLPRLERFVARRFIPDGDCRDWPAIARWAALDRRRPGRPRAGRALNGRAPPDPPSGPGWSAPQPPTNGPRDGSGAIASLGSWRRAASSTRSPNRP